MKSVMDLDGYAINDKHLGQFKSILLIFQFFRDFFIQLLCNFTASFFSKVNIQ